ncbi:uncharacterized protein N7503_003817 [Penicillium pulvis]|uniref:uncharacterized protein n=1 Tax=Penicillium pulvis TaxID=1562058 RepID=UPI002547A209|nr:uncharacterized protein N7503_003817 [Penicillium pulvis]KAJ5806215.1 hypothetical protein N7503_003817 [Penicillium pulvis]
MGGINWQQGEALSTGGSALIGVSLTLSVIQILFVIARFYTHSLQHTKCGADDYVMLVALIGSIAKAVIYVVLVEVAGLGHHVDDLAYPQQNITLTRKGFFALELLDLPLTVTPAKLALLLFYVRIFYVRIFHTRNFQIIPYTIGALVLGLGITVFFQSIFQCNPIESAWDFSVYGACVNQITFYRVISPINVLTGLMIVALPIPLVWRLHARRGQKVALTGVFLLSGLGTVASILRMVMYYRISFAQASDVTWFSVKIAMVSIVESAVIIIATCLVSIWPLVTHIMRKPLFAKLSCCRSRRNRHHHHHHEQWYTHSIQIEPKSADPLPYEENFIQREVSWSSRPSSLAELEDQRSWILEDEDESPRHHPWVSYEVHITAGI